ncbi:hypothetical protein JTE90_003313 [Oedothorax gibbosus]|uniref:Uncharacterized protein n=1 Tax=Oedothorax gibbosus TaxID=931172 RepID=A0AAV6TW78_9ARAC|nr:hypothetical protein JTE90_003313 [Oedothorax gibbosus]
MAENSESSILMDNIELRKMAAEIDPTTEKYSKTETKDSLPFGSYKVSDSANGKSKVFERLISQKVRYFSSKKHIEKACAEEISTKTNATEDSKPRTSSVSELILSIHRNPDEYLAPDFDSICSIESETVYRETTSPKKKKTLKKRMNRLFGSCVCGSNRYHNFSDMYERRISNT